MSTVTFFPEKDSIHFTCKRNETNDAAYAPKIHTFSSGKIVYPSSEHEEGTWIAGHENGNVVIFLDGASEAHDSKPPYRKSRGLILLALIDHFTPLNSFLAVNLNNIEPFTAIIRDNRHLFECRWDGRNKEYEEKDADLSHNWTSVMRKPPAAGQSTCSIEITNESLNMSCFTSHDAETFSAQLKFDSSMAGK